VWCPATRRGGTAFGYIERCWPAVWTTAFWTPVLWKWIGVRNGRRRIGWMASGWCEPCCVMSKGIGRPAGWCMCRLRKTRMPAICSGSCRRSGTNGSPTRIGCVRRYSPRASVANTSARISSPSCPRGRPATVGRCPRDCETGWPAISNVWNCACVRSASAKPNATRCSRRRKLA